MTKRTVVIDDEQWQVVPKRMTDEMVIASESDAYTEEDWLAVLAAAPEPPHVPAGDMATRVIAGALFDFAGYLTTREPTIEFGATADASPMVQLLEQWAAKRGLSLSDAAVTDWQEAVSAEPPAQQPMTAEQAHTIAEEVWDEYGIPRWQTLRIIRDTELHHGIGKGESND